MNINPYKNVVSLGFAGGGNLQAYKTCTIKKKYGVKSYEADIYKTQDNDKAESYEMRLGDKVIGEMSLTINPDSVFISNLESYGRHKYKGIGSNLIQIAVQRSLENGNTGKITLNAQRLHILQHHPEAFYKKMGFKEEVSDNQIYNNLYGIPMRLDVKTNSDWLKRLQNK